MCTRVAAGGNRESRRALGDRELTRGGNVFFPDQKEEIKNDFLEGQREAGLDGRNCDLGSKQKKKKVSELFTGTEFYSTFNARKVGTAN